MEIRIIKSPAHGTLDILLRRKGSGASTPIESVDAVGLVQGRMIEMVCAADVAEKAVGVTVEDIRGNCPQNMVLLAIFGDTASVEAALEEIKRKEKATRKAESLNGFKFMMAEIISGTRTGERMIVVDTISAGIGDRVIVTTGSSARRMLGDDGIPVDAVVVGIIDEDCEFI